MSQMLVYTRPGLQDTERFRTMRDTNPVWRDPQSGVWNIYRYADVTAALANYQTFSSDLTGVFPEMATLTEGNIITMDPPRHQQLRSLVSQAFTPRAIAQLAPRIEEITERLIDRLQGRTRIELVEDLAYPLPMTGIAELLGVPARDRRRFKRWADALLAQNNADLADKEAMERVEAQMRKFHAYLGGLIQQRRRRPRQDLLSQLVAAEIAGQHLSDPEIVGFATILLIAGHVSTTSLLGNALLCLDEHPALQEALRTDPTRIPGAIEEALRYRSPVTQMARVTTWEVQLGDQVIALRRLVNLWLLSANHDERQFENPDDFVIDRHSNPHVTFGKGIHFCLGAPLARLEAQIALGALLRRFSDLCVDPEYQLEPYADPGLNGIKTLHLLVEPA